MSPSTFEPPTHPTTVVQPRPVMTALDLAAVLSVSVRSLFNWIRLLDDPLPEYRPGGQERRFIWSEVEAWLKRRRTIPGNPPRSLNPNFSEARKLGSEALRKTRKAKRARRSRRSGK